MFLRDPFPPRGWREKLQRAQLQGSTLPLSYLLGALIARSGWYESMRRTGCPGYGTLEGLRTLVKLGAFMGTPPADDTSFLAFGMPAVRWEEMDRYLAEEDG
jgi:hypothetical protein